MASYFLTGSFYQKMSRYNVFQYEIPNRMSYKRTLYDHFENFRKIKYQWETIFEKPLAFCEFSLDFQSENGFDLTKDRRIEMKGPCWSRAHFSFSHSLTPSPTITMNHHNIMLAVFPHRTPKIFLK